MPSSLIIVALVVAWLLVLVPIVARRRQEVARTADSTLAARVVRSGGVRSLVEEELPMSNSPNSDTTYARVDTGYAEDLDELADLDEFDRLDAEFEEGFDSEFDAAGPDDADEEADIAESGGVGRTEADGYDAAEYGEYAGYDEYADYEDYEDFEEDAGEPRPYRPGRGGFDPEAAALAARAKYAFRQRVVVFMLLLAVVSAVAGGFLTPLAWWGHAGVDIGLVGYLTYLRRQVRIEQEIRDRRAARMTSTRRVHVQPQERYRPAEAPVDEEAPVAVAASPAAPVSPAAPPEQPVFQRVTPSPSPQLRPGTVVVEADDEDPMFDELDQPDVLPYRRAAGE